MGHNKKYRQRYLSDNVDKQAIGGTAKSEFEITDIKVERGFREFSNRDRYDTEMGGVPEAILTIRVRRDPWTFLMRFMTVTEMLMLLEVTSFLTITGTDLADRFSISGTIFLAMVALYYPTQELLPKVSVVTRVDRWHLYNFSLLFASNVENVAAELVRDVTGETLLWKIEVVLAAVYVFLVVKKALWFIEPLWLRGDGILRKWMELKLRPSWSCWNRNWSCWNRCKKKGKDATSRNRGTINRGSRFSSLLSIRKGRDSTIQNNLATNSNGKRRDGTIQNDLLPTSNGALQKSIPPNSNKTSGGSMLARSYDKTEQRQQSDSIDYDAAPPKVNLLDLAASALSSTLVAADQITSLISQPEKYNARLKHNGSVVTDVDLAAQGVIVQALRSVSTHVRLVGEEAEEEMVQHSSQITGHEERAQEMFRLAQQEILIRYNPNNQTNNNDHPLPLAQTNNTRNGEEESTSKPSTTEDTSIPETISKLEEYQVDASRVCVFIDPLDGTKGYACGDYDPVSILIAIILDEKPCFGVICKPFGHHGGRSSILDTGFFAIYGGTLLGAAYFAGGSRCHLKSQNAELPRAVISSSRSRGVVQEFVTYLASKDLIHPEPMMVSGAGEKSLRILLRSNNEGLWFYPKPGTSLWDVAASDALLRATGGKLTDKNGKELDYSKFRTNAENLDGVVACYNEALHSECIRLFLEGEWNQSS